ncbi:hypothetical protein INT46_008027 [Mucor plumbeus]|uniref:Uncharacterized protein n=1 Tax=Mucor plumbeus TaxID=97098 RepID=A0A8H7R4P4_9FUNG|nr:hypothetical protein INT46_008027 [Mucor plumbeus]
MQIKLFLSLISFVYLVSTVVYAASEAGYNDVYDASGADYNGVYAVSGADYNGVYADTPLTLDLITTVDASVDAVVGEFK